MKARALITGASFGPTTVKAMGQAFDLAWKDVEQAFPTPEQKEAARLCLARGILANAHENSHNVEELRLQGHAALVKEFATEVREARKSNASHG